ncbi:MAG: nuclear transport factor 2 family protein [Gemmatimonadota bacterium]|nr:nuclear transport factor 2 family protein [Gemmatimonadota bacterium]
MTEADFLNVMRGIAGSWTDGDASRAAGFFHVDAVYEEPPKQQFYRGQKTILAFFTDVMSDGPQLTMKWRNTAFDPKTNVGFGEYTFARVKQFHGIVVIQFRDHKIFRWREYQYQSDLGWAEFAGESEFSCTD